MTQKQYDDIADALCEVPLGPHNDRMVQAIEKISEVLKEDNPMFNDQRFIERACSLA